MSKTIQYARYPKLRKRKVTKTYEQGFGQNGGVSSLGASYVDTDSDGVPDTIVKDSPRIGAFKRPVGVVHRSYLGSSGGSNVEVTPVITSGNGATASVDVDENTTAVTTIVATGGGITYSKLTTGTPAEVADQSFFTLDASTGVLTFTSAPDYETPLDGASYGMPSNNVYWLTVVATNSAGSDTQSILVNVKDVVELEQIDQALIAPSGTIFGNTTQVTGTFAYGTDTLNFYIWNGTSWLIFIP